MSGYLQRLSERVVAAMKAEPLTTVEIEAHIAIQKQKQSDARRRLAAVDRKYREYEKGQKPT